MAAACWVIAAFDLFSMYTETTTYIVTDKRNLSIWGPPFLWIIAFLVVGSFGWGIWEKPFAFEPHSLKWAFAIEFGKETRALAPSQQQKKKENILVPTRIGRKCSNKKMIEGGDESAWPASWRTFLLFRS